MSMEVQQFLIDTGGNFTEMAPRPPVPGEETAELQSNGGISTRSSGSLKSHVSCKSHSSGKSGTSLRSDVSHSPAATPRRSNLEKMCGSLGCSDTKLHMDEAPLGFEPEGSAANSPPFTENGTPSYLKWAENIKFLLEDSDGVKLFKQFLDQDQCSNLLDFWFACKGLKMVDKDNVKRICDLSKLIFKKYIKGDNLALRMDIKKNIIERRKHEQVDHTLFDEAQNEVESKMKNDAYPQFLKSDIYLQYVQSGGESPKTSNNTSGSSSARPMSGPLPTVPENEELTNDEIKSALLPLTPASLSFTRKHRDHGWSMRKESMFPPKAYKMTSPYHVSYAPVSQQDSELQSLSSDAMTDDTKSLTDSSIDGRVGIGELPGYGKKAWKKHHKTIRRYAEANRHTQLNQHANLIPRTERAPKDRNLAEKEPEKFAMVLIDKLARLKEEQDKLERVRGNLHSIETDEESEVTKAVSLPPVVAAKPLPRATNALGKLLEMADKDREDNAQSILEEHCSRVWDNSNSQTPSRSPGRHSPKSFLLDHSIRYPHAPGPSPNVSTSIVFPTYPKNHSSSHFRKKEKDTSVSYDSGVGKEDKTAAGLYFHESETHHQHVYHHHHHHHHNVIMKENALAKSRAAAEKLSDSTDQHNRSVDTHPHSLHHNHSAPVLQNFNDTYLSHRGHNHSMYEDQKVSRGTRDSKRPSGAKKTSDSNTSNMDSGVGLTSESAPASVPNLHDPSNEKVIAWMLENDKITTGATHGSTEESEKGSSSHKKSTSSHRSSSGSHNKSLPSGGKKSSQYSNSRSGSLDRGYVSFHHGSTGAADYSYSSTPMGLSGAGSGVQPSQPIIQDPSMPLLNPPNPTTQLEEARRRLEDESRAVRTRPTKSSSSSSSSQRDRRAMPPPPPPHPIVPQRLSHSSSTQFTKANIPQVAPLDLSSSEDHSSYGSHKSEKRVLSQKKSSSVPTTPGQQGDVTIVGYWFCNEPIPYRTSLPGKQVTLGQFKQLISKRGNYRYFFKTASDEFDSGVVHEEIHLDHQLLPLWEGKVVGKVEKRE